MREVDQGGEGETAEMERVKIAEDNQQAMLGRRGDPAY